MARTDTLCIGLLAVVLGLTSSDAPAEEQRAAEGGRRVRVHAGDTREIPGAITLGPSVVARGQLVASDERLVAVRVAGKDEVVCLPMPRTTQTGRLIATDGEGLLIHFDGQKAPFKVPRYAVDSIEVSVGREGSRGKNALIGLVVGALTGALLGAATGGDDAFVTQGAAAGAGAATLGLLGAGIGAALPVQDRWQTMPVDQLRAGHGRHHPDRLPGFSLAFAF